MHAQANKRIHSQAGRYFFTLSLLLALIVGCKPEEEPVVPKPQSDMEAITLYHGSITNILPRIALEKGYFAAEGLNVTLKNHNGLQAFTGMLQGECNFAVTGEPPIVLADPQHTPFTILATIMSDEDAVKIIARRDRGITTPQDLKGKRIGVKKGVFSHNFLDLFLLRHGLKQNEVILVFMEPQDFKAALVSGQIDAFSNSNQLITETKKILGDKVVIFAEPGLCPANAILTTNPDIARNLQAAPRLLQALIRAEQYAQNEPSAAKAIVLKAAKLPAQEIDELWNRATIKVELTNDLFSHLESQYLWLHQRGGGSQSVSLPNYLTLVSPQYLRAIKPEAISTLIR